MANTEVAVKFLQEVEGSHIMRGDESCKNLNLTVDLARSQLDLEIGERNLFMADKLRYLELTDVTLKDNTLTIVKTIENDDTFDSWFTGKSKITVKIEKQGNKLKKLSSVYKFKGFMSPLYRTVNKINCK